MRAFTLRPNPGELEKVATTMNFRLAASVIGEITGNSPHLFLFSGFPKKRSRYRRHTCPFCYGVVSFANLLRVLTPARTPQRKIGYLGMAPSLSH